MNLKQGIRSLTLCGLLLLGCSGEDNSPAPEDNSVDKIEAIDKRLTELEEARSEAQPGATAEPVEPKNGLYEGGLVGDHFEDEFYRDGKLESYVLKFPRFTTGLSGQIEIIVSAEGDDVFQRPLKDQFADLIREAIKLDKKAGYFNEEVPEWYEPWLEQLQKGNGLSPRLDINNLNEFKEILRSYKKDIDDGKYK